MNGWTFPNAAAAGPGDVLAHLRHGPASAVSRRRGPASRRAPWRASATTKPSAREGGTGTEERA
jgi:hypothetical protein